MILIRLFYHLDKTRSGPLLGWTQETSEVVGSRPKVQVEISASGSSCFWSHTHSNRLVKFIDVSSCIFLHCCVVVTVCWRSDNLLAHCWDGLWDQIRREKGSLSVGVTREPSWPVRGQHSGSTDPGYSDTCWLILEAESYSGQMVTWSPKHSCNIQWLQLNLCHCHLIVKCT